MESSRSNLREKRAAELEAKKKKLEELKKRKAAAKQSAAAPESQDVSGEKRENMDAFIENILQSTTTRSPEKVEQPSADPQPIPTATSVTEKMVQLSIVNNVAELHMDTAVTETYAKYTQTDFVEPQVGIDPEAESEGYANQSPMSAIGSSSPRSPRSPKLSSEQPSEQQLLTTEQKESILHSNKFEEFVNRTSRVIERAMQQSLTFDIMMNYGDDSDDNEEIADSEELLQKSTTFFDDRWCQNRTVTDVDVSPFFTELVLVAYSSKNDSSGKASSAADWSFGGSTDPDGIVLLWSTAVPNRPEYIFTCQSQVLVARFHPFDRHLLIGGTYCGEILLWDTRSKSAPVHRTPLSTSGHTHPIFSLEVVGTKNLHTLVSASTDGRICVWNLENMSTPTNVIEIRTTVPQTINTVATGVTNRDKKLDICVTTLAIEKNSNNRLCVGSESGDIYKVEIHSDSTEVKKSEIREALVSVAHKKHFGPITSLEYNPQYDSAEELLLLSASVDWSFNVWSSKSPEEPLFSFEHADDYVYDAKWSPTHRSLFATVDGAGCLSLWNICTDREMPVAEAKVTSNALNKAKWSNNGKRIIVGDSVGKVYAYEVASQICTPRQDENSALEKIIAGTILKAAAP